MFMGTKKGMGVTTSAHPRLQALALPHFKDKQCSQPTPSDYIYNLMTYIIAYHKLGYNLPTQTLNIAIIFCEMVQTCEI